MTHIQVTHLRKDRGELNLLTDICFTARIVCMQRLKKFSKKQLTRARSCTYNESGDDYGKRK
jgi:hypothetical protein